MAKRHDHDAGGDAGLLEAKSSIREDTWARMSADGVARFPRPDGRIPNFVGAEAAADRLRSTEAWTAARTVKANPDSPQWPVRQRALEDGKTVYMAMPRLAEADTFFLLDPDALADTPRKASSIKGAARSARTVPIDDLEPVDLVITGSVAVDESGARLGKGGGFSDLEYALASMAGLIGPDTVVATTVHELQIRPVGEIPVADHDFPLDLIVTPDRILRCPTTGRRFACIHWEALTADKIASIPLLAALNEDR